MADEESLPSDVWRHLKAACAADPARASRLVMVGEKDVLAAVAEALAERSPLHHLGFRVGDRVRHPDNGDGTVMKVMDTVDVTFDRVGSGGQHWRGSYPESWFKLVGKLTHIPHSRIPPETPGSK